MTLNVPSRFTSITRLKAANGIGCPSRRRILVAGPIPAQLTTTRSGPRASATSSAVPTWSSSVTSAGANLARSPSRAASRSPSEPGRSSRTTPAAVASRCSAVARPRPEAPPVIRATPSVRSTAPYSAGFCADSVHSPCGVSHGLAGGGRDAGAAGAFVGGAIASSAVPGAPDGRFGDPRDVAQLGSALDWGSRGREFKSRRPDEQTAGQWPVIATVQSPFLHPGTHHTRGQDPLAPFGCRSSAAGHQVRTHRCGGRPTPGAGLHPVVVGDERASPGTFEPELIRGPSHLPLGVGRSDRRCS